MIRCKLSELADKKGVSVRQVARDIQIRPQTANDMALNRWERAPKYVMDRLCAYFEVTPGDLFEYVKEDEAVGGGPR